MDDYEYVISAGPGTLIQYGVARGHSAWHELEEVVCIAADANASFHAEPCKPDCETGSGIDWGPDWNEDE